MSKPKQLIVPLSTIPIDTAAALRLPYRLANYYCAIPIGEEEGTITVIMSQSDDKAAINVIESLLASPIVPIQGDAKEIRAALQKVWASQNLIQQPRVLCWGGTTPHVNLIAGQLTASIVPLDMTVHTVESALQVAHTGDFILAAIHLPQGHSISAAARHAATPLLILGQDAAPLKKILLVLRGHSPDHRVLDWVIPLAQAEDAAVTLLYVALPLLPFYTRETRKFQALGMLLSKETEPGSHVYKCGERIRQAGVQGYLKLRQGPIHQQIANEIEEGEYDFVALAAESHGEFVGQVLGEVESRSLHRGRPILVMKPALP